MLLIQLATQVLLKLVETWRILTSSWIKLTLSPEVYSSSSSKRMQLKITASFGLFRHLQALLQPHHTTVSMVTTTLTGKTLWVETGWTRSDLDGMVQAHLSARHKDGLSSVPTPPLTSMDGLILLQRQAQLSGCNLVKWFAQIWLCEVI